AAIGRKLEPEFRGGVWFVKLSMLHSPQHFASHVSASIGLEYTISDPSKAPAKHPTDKRERIALAKLIRHFKSAQRLLILDNCENLREAPGLLVDTLLKECPDIRILVTSRRSLELISWGGDVPLNPLSHTDSSGLFMDRIGTGVEVPREKMTELSQLLEGNPL